MKEIYRLEANGRVLVRVTVDLPDWWPLPVRLNSPWIRSLIRLSLSQKPLVV